MERVSELKSAGRSEAQRAALVRLVARIADRLRLNAYVELWDGTRLPLGPAPTSDLAIHIAGPDVIASLVRWPTLDRVIRHYATGGLSITGGTFLEFAETVSHSDRTRGKLRPAEILAMLKELRPFLFAPGRPPSDAHGFHGDIVGHKPRSIEDNKHYIQFHYDLSNAFYALFLDPEMLYSCAYFTDWQNDLATAQRDKLDMICRKLRLKPGERFLDIGCGWGALVCHAAANYGVSAHGITLSENQLAFAREKVARLRLADRVTLELRDYRELDGQFDKIASIGMYEHIGIRNIPGYMSKIRGLLSEDGLFLNHAIARAAHRRRLLPARMRPEQRALAKYIFPGGELDDIGHTIAEMERAKFEVQDVEAWRLHYARTCELWHDRLVANQAAAIAEVGPEKYRIFIAFLAGVAISFRRGTALIFQTLVSRSPKRPPALPPTRADLYR